MRRSRIAVAVLLVVLLGGIGCTDLCSVAEFAKVSKTASEAFPEIVKDMLASCQHRQTLAPRGVTVDCQKIREAQPGLMQAQGVLVGYLTAMEALATDKALTSSARITALPTDLKQAGLSEPQTKAAVGISDRLISMALRSYRRGELIEIIGDSNQDIQELTKALNTIVGEDYARLLSLERLAVEDYYKTALTQGSEREPLAAILVKQAWDRDVQDLDRRTRAATAYARVLEALRDGHQKLYDQRKSLNAKELITVVGPDVEKIGGSLGDLYGAFK